MRDINYKNDVILTRGAIVCNHVAMRIHPILHCFHTNSVDSADSGWQFFCGVEPEESISDVQIWSLSEVIRLEPTLSRFMELPEGMSVWRSKKELPWEVAPISS